MKQTTLAISFTLLACGQVGTSTETAPDLDQGDAGAGVQAAPSMPLEATPAAEHSPDAGINIMVAVVAPRIEVEHDQEDDQEDAGAPVDADDQLLDILDAGNVLDAGLDASDGLDIDAGDGPAVGSALTPEQIAELCSLQDPPPEARPFCP